MEELNRKLPQLPWIIAVVGLAIAGWFFLSANKVNADLGLRQSELEACNLKLAQCEKFAATYGHGSDRYYADKPVLILRTGGAEGKFKIYWDSEGKKDSSARWTCPENGKGITVKWGEAFKDHLADFFVTSGKKAGVYSITFTDNINDDTFQVLVIVKE